MNIRHFRELKVYGTAKQVALDVYARTKEFPREERYSLTDQIRRSSRSVCANIAEAWRRRLYEAAFTAKLADAQAECAETQVWLEFATAHGYLRPEEFAALDDQCEQVCAMLTTMCSQRGKWTIRPRN